MSTLSKKACISQKMQLKEHFYVDKQNGWRIECYPDDVQIQYEYKLVDNFTGPDRKEPHYQVKQCNTVTDTYNDIVIDIIHDYNHT